MVDLTGGDGRPGAVHTVDPPGEPTLEGRICAAALTCIARDGLTGTTVDDIAEEAGCSRATLYRLFPGGREVLLAATVAREIDRAVTELTPAIAAAPDLPGALEAAVGGASRFLAGHAALVHLLEHEPAVVLPHVAFDGLDPLLGVATDHLAPLLERFLAPPVAVEAAEWAARLVVLYLGDPAAPLDLTKPDDVRRLVHTYVLPGLVPPPETEHLHVQH